MKKITVTKISSSFFRSGRIGRLALPKFVDHEGFVERLVFDAKVHAGALVTPTQLQETFAEAVYYLKMMEGDQ